MEKIECLQCGKQIEKKNYNQKFCSIKCKIAFYGTRHKYTIECKQCRKKFHPHRKTQLFCSRECAVKGRKGKTKRQTVKYNTQCAECGKPLYRKQSYLNKTKVICCSKTCFANSQRKRYKGSENPNFQNVPLKRCEGCGKLFKSYSKTRRYCGPSCGHSKAASEAIANLTRGYQAEIWCRNKLQEQGYHATLSAGSKGEYDVIAISQDEILLIQVKRTKSRQPGRIFPKPALIKLVNAKAPNHKIIHKQMWTWVDNIGWKIKEVENGKPLADSTDA